jgi:oxygen-independent coproporphyrinogen-3 oxidase
MTFEFIFDTETATRSEILDQLIESEVHVPGLVFSYPPISTWRPENSAELTPEQLWNGSEVFSHNLYIHIPFCRQKCSFCYYSVAVHADDTEIIWEYLRCLEIEAKRYAQTTHAGARIETVFIGGGTPSRLNEAQIEFLFERVIGRFDLSNCREITYECSPDSATKPRIDTMAKLGVNRLSMGVQTLDPEILRASRRNDSPDEVIETYYNMVDSGVPNVNIDLIAGIEKEALDNIERTMEAVAALDPIPTQITLFTLSVREGAINKTTLKQEDPAALFRRSLTLYRYAKRRMLAMGYWQYSRNLFPREDYIFHYQDNHWGNNGYVLALGASGYSHSHGYTFINAFNYREYMRRATAGDSTVEKVFPLSADESLRRHLVLAMKHAELDIARFESFYPAGSKPLAKFMPAFQALEALGAVTIDAEEIRYTPDFADLSDRFVRLFYSAEVNRRIRQTDALTTRSKADSFSFTV